MEKITIAGSVGVDVFVNIRSSGLTIFRNPDRVAPQEHRKNFVNACVYGVVAPLGQRKIFLNTKCCGNNIF